MKTFTIFCNTNDLVSMEVYGAGADGKRDKTRLFIKENFPITEDMQGLLATNKDGEFMSLASYGLCRLMQDRCSGFHDKFYGGAGMSSEEGALDRVSEYQKVYELVKAGRFNAERVAGSKKASIGESIVRAFVIFCTGKGKQITDAQAMVILGGLEKEKLDAIKKVITDAGHVKQALLELKAEREEATNAIEELDLDGLF